MASHAEAFLLGPCLAQTSNFACSLDLVFVGFQLRFTTPVFRIATVQSYLVSTLWSFNVVSGTTAPFSCDFSFAGFDSDDKRYCGLQQMFQFRANSIYSGCCALWTSLDSTDLSGCMTIFNFHFQTCSLGVAAFHQNSSSLVQSADMPIPKHWLRGEQSLRVWDASHSNRWLDAVFRSTAMDDWWPGVSDGILGHLKCMYLTPLRLDAAFDNDEECSELLSSEFPDMVGEDLLDAVAVMSEWKESMARPLKRARAEVVRVSLFRLPLPGQLSVQDEFSKLIRTSAICILEMHVKQKQKRYREDPADPERRGLRRRGKSTPSCWLRC